MLWTSGYVSNNLCQGLYLLIIKRFIRHHPYILLSFTNSQSFRIPSWKTCFCYGPMCIPHHLLNGSLSSSTFYPTVIRTSLRAVSPSLLTFHDSHRFQDLILAFIKKVRNYAGNRMGNRAWDCWLRCSYLVARDASPSPDGSNGSAIEGTFNGAILRGIDLFIETTKCPI
jgi:hypothetical protein